MDRLTELVMQVCDCTSCYENKPCEKVLKVTEQIRKMKVRLTQRAPDSLDAGEFSATWIVDPNNIVPPAISG